MSQSCFCTKHCFIIQSSPQFEEVCNMYSGSSVRILQMRKEVQRNLLRDSHHGEALTGPGLNWFLFTVSLMLFLQEENI